MAIKIRSAYSPHERVTTSTGESSAKQQFAAECDINNIMAKYQTQGVLEHIAKNEGNYGFATSLDFRQGLEVVEEANDMFAELPSSTRKKFNNSPEEFLDWVQDPANAETLDEMGNIDPPETPETPVIPAPPAEPAPVIAETSGGAQ